MTKAQHEKQSFWISSELIQIGRGMSGGGDGEQHTAPLHGRQGPTECQWNHKASRKVPSEILSLIAA